MDLQVLRNFLVVVEQGSISNAALLVRLSQPALSRQLRALEEEFGAELFTRKRRGVELTAAGETLALQARCILANVREAQVAIDAVTGKRGGRIALGVPSSLAGQILPVLIRQAREIMPDVRLAVREGQPDVLCAQVIEGQLDLAIAQYPSLLPGLSARPLFSESIVAAGAAGVFEAGTAVTMKQFLQRDCVLAASTGRLRLMYEKLAVRAGTPASGFVEVDSPSSLVDLIAQGVGVSLVSYTWVHREVIAGRISIAPIAPVPLRRQVALVSAAARSITPAQAQLADMIAQFVERHASEFRWEPIAGD